MEDTILYMWAGYLSLSTLAAMVWLLKQLILLIKCFIKFYMTEQQKIDSIMKDGHTKE